MIIVQQVDKGGISLVFLLSISIFFPLFPLIFGNSPIHLVPLNITLCLVMWICHKRHYVKLNSIFIIWATLLFVQYLLLNISLMVDAVSIPLTFSGLFGTLKPLYTLLFLYVGFCLNFSYERFESLIRQMLIIVLLITLVVGIFEIFFISDGSLFYSLYKREERYILDGKSTSWFGVTYYHSFFFFFFFCYFFVRRVMNKKDAFFLMVSLFLVLASQSRTLIVSLMLFLFIFTAIQTLRRPIVAFKIFVVAIVFFVIASFYIEELIEHFGYVFGAFDQLIKLGAIDFMFSGSVGERIRQIGESLENQNYLFGAGLGRNGIALESIYASYIFRFGFVWGFIFISFYSFFGYYLVKKAGSRNLMRAVGYFWLMSPVTMFASPMIDFPKINLFLFIITGFLVRCLKENPREINFN